MSLCFEDACPVSMLKDKIEQLEKEADWLALAHTKCPSRKRVLSCKEVTVNDEICTRCWREAAKKEVERACNHA